MKFIRNPQIFSKLIDGGWVLLKQNSSYCFKLNETAGVLWENLDKTRTSDYLIKKLTDIYEISNNQAKKDVGDFLKYGLKHGFIISND